MKKMETRFYIQGLEMIFLLTSFDKLEIRKTAKSYTKQEESLSQTEEQRSEAEALGQWLREDNIGLFGCRSRQGRDL